MWWWEKISASQKHEYLFTPGTIERAPDIARLQLTIAGVRKSRVMLDDDDADLSNGTPHYNEIAAAFGAHGLPAPALTLFDPMARTELATLARVTPTTGRTHQIRVHAAHMGHPVAGDEKYGDPEFNRQLRSEGLRRLFLHAWSLSFPHPMTGEALEVKAPLDGELQTVLRGIGLPMPDSNEC